MPRRDLGRKLARLSLLLLFCLNLPLSAYAQRVAFVNPGRHDESYWVAASEAMQAAARSLGMQLETQYAERDHLQMLALVKELAARKPAARPDYLILVNERRMGGEMLRIASAAGIKCLFAFNTLLPEDQLQYGHPRGAYPLWLGSIVPHAEDAGYLTARALIARGLREHRFGADGKIHMVAIAGDRSTESSLLRNRGMERAVKESPQVVLEQTVYADWRRDTARTMAAELYARYPETTLVWAGSDQMALGAIEAHEGRGGRAGTERWFSGVNTSSEAMQAVIDGRLEALAGGHFMAGAWAMVMIYDHAHGRDFRGEGLELDKPMFSLFDAELARRFLDRFGNGLSALDFRGHSRALNRRREHYDFSFASLL